MCFGDFSPVRTLCDAYKEFESHERSILDISRFPAFFLYCALCFSRQWRKVVASLAVTPVPAAGHFPQSRFQTSKIYDI